LVQRASTRDAAARNRTHEIRTQDPRQRERSSRLRRQLCPKKFTEPVALSSTQPADLPLPRTALTLSFNLLALRARCVDETMGRSAPSQGGELSIHAVCKDFFGARGGEHFETRRQAGSRSRGVVDENRRLAGQSADERSWAADDACTLERRPRPRSTDPRPREQSTSFARIAADTGGREMGSTASTATAGSTRAVTSDSLR
jgi:hypothetical protein